jgi:hypothetical protein
MEIKTNTTNRSSNRISGCLLAAILGITPAVSLAGVPGARSLPNNSGNSNPAVLPVQSHAYGLSYSEWSARWWQWFFSLPIDSSPLFGTADCSFGQSGPVWFLGGGPSPRPNCTVPAGTALFFPIINAECSNLEGNGTTDSDLRGCANFIESLIDPATLNATLDGVPLTSLSQYRVQSPLFTFGPLPANNLITYFCIAQGEGCPAAPAGTTGISVSDGFYLMLHPLPPGSHTLHFHGEIPVANFVVDMTYHLTVTP